MQSFSTPADLRLGFVRQHDSNVIYCGEPMPDVALNSEASGSGNLAVALNASQAAQMNAAMQRVDDLARENEALREDLREREANRQGATSENRSAQRSGRSRSQEFGAGAEAQYSGSLDAAASARVAITVAQLAGRTQQVLLIREYFYRLCEARANNFITATDDNYTALLRRGLDMIEKVEEFDAQARVAEAKRVETDAEKRKRDLAEFEEKLRKALLDACTGDYCTTLVKQASFDVDDKLLRLRLQDLKYTPPTVAPNVHVYESTDATRKAVLKLPASDWNVGTITDSIWLKKVSP